jgi:hypothetical protein
MKYLFILLLSLSFATAYSTPDSNKNVAPEVLASFQKNFTKADNVSWTEGDAFFRADFTFNAQHITAFFSKSGAMMGTTRNLSFTQLPVILQTNLKELQQDNWIAELFELSNEDGTSYFITLENANERTVLRSDKNDWTLYQKKTKM